MKSLKVIFSCMVVLGMCIVPDEVIADDADWGQIAIFANEAWERGEAIGACRLSIHAAHRINVERSGSDYEIEYMRDYVAKYCGAIR